MIPFRAYITEEAKNKNTQNLKYKKIGFTTEQALNLVEYEGELWPGENPDYESEYPDDTRWKSKENAYEDINRILQFFESMPEPIPVYRTVKVKDISEVDLENPGESWSYDKESALNFARNQAGGNVLLSGFIKAEHVNWKSTLKAYFEFSEGFDSYDENEITADYDGNVFNIKAEYITKKKTGTKS